MLADLGMSKIMTISSTYDHRIIQGAESGLFLKRVHELLMGEDDFYEEVFRSVGVPYEAVAVASRREPRRPRSLHARQADAGPAARQHAPGPRPPHRRPRPAVERGAPSARRARPGDLRTHHLGPRPGVPHRRHRRTHPHEARRHAARAARRLLPHDRHRVHAHPGPGREALDPGARGGSLRRGQRGREAPHPRAAQRRRSPREVPRHEVRRSEALRPRRRRIDDPRCSTPCCPRPPTRTCTRPCSAWPTAVG